MNKYLKIFLIVFAIGLVVGLSAVYYIFHMPHRNLANEKPAFSMDAEQIVKDFQADENMSNQKYLDKAVQISGSIVDITNDKGNVTFVLLDKSNGVSCAMDSANYAEHKTQFANVKIGDKITVRGKCDVFDPIMGLVVSRCVYVDGK